MNDFPSTCFGGHWQHAIARNKNVGIAPVLWKHDTCFQSIRRVETAKVFGSTFAAARKTCFRIVVLFVAGMTPVAARPTILFGQETTLSDAPAVEREDQATRRANPKEPEAPPELRLIINCELSFVKRACELSDDQMAPIVKSAREAHKAMAGFVIDTDEMRPFGERRIHFLVDDRFFKDNPYTKVRTEFAKLLIGLVSEKQYQQYLEESRLRAEYERQTAIRLAIAALDEKLGLAAEQRTRLLQELAVNWPDIDYHVWEGHALEQSAFPGVPTRIVNPILTESQRDTLQSIKPSTVYVYIDHESFFPLLETEEWIK
jgi:hypothetical protein